MTTKRGSLIWGLCLWIITTWGVGPQSVGAKTSDSDPSGFAFQVNVPEPTFLLQLDGSSKIEIEGFRAVERQPGAPNLPTQTFLIAIPPGAVPRLEYTVRGTLRLHERRPTPVPRLRLDAAKLDHEKMIRFDRDLPKRVETLAKATTETLEADPSLYSASAADVPWVRLGKPGTIRAQRYVTVYVRGARWDGERQLVEVPRGFDIRVAFDVTGAVEEAPPPVEPLFEDVYRQHFLNYDQGRGFRMTGPAQVAMMGAPATPATRSGSTPSHKLRVVENGPLRMDFALLDAAGLTAHAIDTWRLENRGEQVPLTTNDDGDGILEPGEWVQFYGQALDSEPHTVVNTDFPGTTIDLFEDRDFSDENIYFLTVDPPGQPAMPEDPSPPQFALTPPLMVDATVHEETDDGYRPLGAADPWYWLPTLFATGAANRVDTVSLPQLHDPTAGLQVRVHLRGASEVSAVNPDHQTQVSLLNQADQVLATDPATFDGRVLYLHDFGWTFSGVAASNPVKIQIEAIDIGGGNRNDVILDFIEIDYQRSFIADTDRFEFSWPNGDQEFLIDGFTGTEIEVWELTAQSGAGVIQPVRLTGVQVAASGPGVFSARFLMDNDAALADGTPRRFVAFGSGSVALLAGTEFPVDVVSDLRDPLNQADLVVIAHDDVLDASPGSALDNLLAHRATPAGGGLTSKVVRLEDIQDDFNFGLAGPQAIREFLRWIVSTEPGEGWASPKPALVLLLGDGSFDYKGGAPQGNLVPTQIVFKDVIELGFYASDNLLAAVVGDDSLADLVVGRLPARTLPEAEIYLEKTLDYETLAPAGDWTKHALTISDKGKGSSTASEAFEFEFTNAAGLAEMGTLPYTRRELKYYADYFEPGVPDAPNVMRQDIKDAVNGNDMFSGAALVQFSGHGNFVVWSDDAFLDERFPPNLDTSDLMNGLKLPWVIVHNCLSGGFHSTLFETMGEDWLRRIGGGAMGVFAPSGLSTNYLGLPVTQWVWGSMFGPQMRRDVAGPVMSVWTGLCGQNSIEPCQQYVLLGDPAARLQLRSVEPATAVQATGSNLQVELNWTASDTPGATYRVLRTESLVFPYSQRAAGVVGTTYTDTPVQNTHTYYYIIIATDPEGFESRWSNFNTDCQVSGPDCVQATPLNPDPPSIPTGLQVVDPGLGDRLIFIWNTNPEEDLDFYTVKWGLGAGNPTDAGQSGTPIFTALGLVDGEVYCATVSATNTSGNQSSDTVEVCDFPVFAPGVRLPDFIDDLKVSIQAANVVLEWTEVVTDVYGKPANVVNYEIFRGNPPDYSNGGLTKIADCAAPCSSYQDFGAATGPSVHYRVRAVDGAGRPGSLGSEAPMGVGLTVERAPVFGDVRLTWTPATVTLDGLPVDLGHYALYASDTPFSKEDVVDGVLTPMLTLTGTSIDLTPPAESRYYSVWVVDTRGNMSPD